MSAPGLPNVCPTATDCEAGETCTEPNSGLLTHPTTSTRQKIKEPASQARTNMEISLPDFMQVSIHLSTQSESIIYRIPCPRLFTSSCLTMSEGTVLLGPGKPSPERGVLRAEWVLTHSLIVTLVLGLTNGTYPANVYGSVQRQSEARLSLWEVPSRMGWNIKKIAS